jgi:hypothetical protein
MSEEEKAKMDKKGNSRQTFSVQKSNGNDSRKGVLIKLAISRMRRSVFFYYWGKGIGAL